MDHSEFQLIGYIPVIPNAISQYTHSSGGFVENHTSIPSVASVFDSNVRNGTSVGRISPYTALTDCIVCVVVVCC